eukprot:g5227.t1
MKVRRLATKKLVPLPPRGKQQRRSSPIASDNSTGSDRKGTSNSKKKGTRKRQKTTETATSQLSSNFEPLREKGIKISTILKELFPVVEIPLKHETPFQLLVAVLLSAQCTDNIVNKCTPDLFKRAPDPQTMANLDVAVIQEYIKKINFAPTKAKHVSKMSQMLLDEHDGEVPSTFEALEALPGVGHKTASVVKVQAFGQDAFPVDTHVHRLAKRWGLSSGKNVVQTEEDLKQIFPIEEWKEVSLRIILFGRKYCPAKKHDQKTCPICSWVNKQSDDEA